MESQAAWRAFLDARAHAQKLQGGTGQHLDGNVAEGPVEENGRPFQAQVVLRSQLPGDGSLQVVPGFHWFAADFFRVAGTAVPPGEFYALREQHDAIRDGACWWYVRRVPDAWDPAVAAPPGRARSCEGVARRCRRLRQELAELPPALPPQEGDYILWDPRLLHSTGEPDELNCTGQVRQTFYCAYRHCSPASKYVAQEQVAFRTSGEHPAWGAASHTNVEESEEYAPLELDALGKRLYGAEPWRKVMTAAERRAQRAERKATGAVSGARPGSNDNKDAAAAERKFLDPPNSAKLTPRLLAFFIRYGFVVVPSVVSLEKTSELRAQIDAFLRSRYSIDMSTHETIRASLTLSRLRRMISSYGSGMVELFWLQGMDAIRTDPHVYSVFASLLEGTWAAGKRPFQNSAGIEHAHRLLIYADRCNLRFPESLLEECCCGGRPEGGMPAFGGGDLMMRMMMAEDEDEDGVAAAAAAAGSKRPRAGRRGARRATSWNGRLVAALKRRRRPNNREGSDVTIKRSDIRWLPDRAAGRAIEAMHRQLGAPSEVSLPFLEALEGAVMQLAHGKCREEEAERGENEEEDYGSESWLKRRKLDWRRARGCRRATKKIAKERGILEVCTCILDQLVTRVAEKHGMGQCANLLTKHRVQTDTTEQQWLQRKKRRWGATMSVRRILNLRPPPETSIARHETEHVAAQVAWISNVLEVSARSDAGRADFPDAKEVVTVYYTNINPVKLRDVAGLCEHFKGREDTMYAKMEEVYGSHPLDEIAMHVPEVALRRKVKAVLFECISAVEEVHLKYL
jgi:hypothetical protein